MSTAFDQDALRASALVETLEVHAELGSTNDRAKRVATTGAPLPALIVAERQTAGRGRASNRWWAGDGALTFSLLIDPAAHGLKPQDQGLLSLTTAIAVIDAVQQTTGLRCGYKWPNDVWLEGKKLAGVLLESPRPDRLILGVGVNVENRLEPAPTAVRGSAASLADTSVTRQRVLAAFLGALTKRVSQLASGDAGPLNQARSHDVLAGQSVIVDTAAGKFEGRGQGLADSGALLIQCAGELREVQSGTLVQIG